MANISDAVLRQAYRDVLTEVNPELAKREQIVDEIVDRLTAFGDVWAANYKSGTPSKLVDNKQEELQHWIKGVSSSFSSQPNFDLPQAASPTEDEAEADKAEVGRAL